MENIFNSKPESLEYIKVINGRWHLNQKPFNEMTLGERFRIAEHIKSM